MPQPGTATDTTVDDHPRTAVPPDMPMAVMTAVDVPVTVEVPGAAMAVDMPAGAMMPAAADINDVGRLRLQHRQFRRRRLDLRTWRCDNEKGSRCHQRQQARFAHTILLNNGSPAAAMGRRLTYGFC